MKHSRREPPDLLILLNRLGDLWVTYIKGQFLLSLIMGVATWIVGSAIGLHWAFGIGLVAGILQTIPGFGPIVAAVPAVVVALLKGSSVIAIENAYFALLVAGTCIVLQQVSQFLIEPRVMGKRLSLSPVVILVGVMIGAALGNIVGAYLAVPIMASIREIIRFYHQRRRASTPS